MEDFFPRIPPAVEGYIVKSPDSCPATPPDAPTTGRVGEDFGFSRTYQQKATFLRFRNRLIALMIQHWSFLLFFTQSFLA